MEIAVMLPVATAGIALRLGMDGLDGCDGNFARSLGVLRQGSCLQTPVTAVLTVATTPATIGLVRLVWLGLDAGRTRLAGAPPALAGLVAPGALLGFWVFRNRMRNLRFRYHGSRRTRALLAPPLATPGPARPLLLSRIRRTRFKRPVAGIGVAHVFVHSRRAKTLWAAAGACSILSLARM
jgi:hypothetical protein